VWLPSILRKFCNDLVTRGFSNGVTSKLQEKWTGADAENDLRELQLNRWMHRKTMTKNANLSVRKGKVTNLRTAWRSNVD
jgi:hypothetical protein